MNDRGRFAIDVEAKQNVFDELHLLIDNGHVVLEVDEETISGDGLLTVNSCDIQNGEVMAIERDSRASMVEGTHMLKKPECKVDFFRGRVLRVMNGCNYTAAVGGSLSNSLVTLTRLNYISIGGHALIVAMAGNVSSDPLVGFYMAELHRENVNFHYEFIKDGTT
ncbi:hypothetical protein V6N13_053307 [Hibiscus sabdariffa]|uniref:Uncharacterized protein n=2 Tax=Hibiscus sabdariffa TaxID=183260 RepID=A0ABR2AN30_9ROSI